MWWNRCIKDHNIKLGNGSLDPINQKWWEKHPSQSVDIYYAIKFGKNTFFTYLPDLRVELTIKVDWSLKLHCGEMFCYHSTANCFAWKALNSNWVTTSTSFFSNGSAASSLCGGLQDSYEHSICNTEYQHWSFIHTVWLDDLTQTITCLHTHTLLVRKEQSHKQCITKKCMSEWKRERVKERVCVCVCLCACVCVGIINELG